MNEIALELESSLLLGSDAVALAPPRGPAEAVDIRLETPESSGVQIIKARRFFSHYE